jgi:two-component system chemotaxis response regulator CheY
MARVCLVVDDSRVVRKVARRILEAHGFDVTEAGDGQQALVACRANMPDCVLLDWNMPVMNGLDLISAVRAESRFDATRLLMVTSETDARHVYAALKAGVDEYAMKPITRDVIGDKLSMLGLTPSEF